jgi:hypothetical protein
MPLFSSIVFLKAREYTLDSRSERIVEQAGNSPESIMVRTTSSNDAFERFFMGTIMA